MIVPPEYKAPRGKPRGGAADGKLQRRIAPQSCSRVAKIAFTSSSASSLVRETVIRPEDQIEGHRLLALGHALPTVDIKEGDLLQQTLAPLLIACSRAPLR